MRKLVIFSDHSWKQPQIRSKRRHVLGNAAIAERCLLEQTSKGEKQITFLQSDQDLKGRLSRFFKRRLGIGVRKEVFQAYEFLVNNYIPGDEIYLIGSGRGAFVLQYLAYMLSTAGLLQADSIGKIKQAYIYSRLTGSARRGPSGQALRDSFNARVVPIKFLGCWDTVGSHGAPVRGLRKLSVLWTEFLSQNVASNVETAFQALALDEQNTAITPHIWQGVKSKNLRRIEQVWFAGRHMNVTGGQRDSRLSDIALRWLIKKASEEGLTFDIDKLEELTTPNPLGQMTQYGFIDRFFNLFSLFNQPRAVGKADTELSRLQIPGAEKLHHTVQERQKGDPDYRPLAYERLPAGSLVISQNLDDVTHSTRRYERHILNCPATLLVNDSRYNGNVLDLSEGGARVWLHLDVPVGTPVTLRSSILMDQGKTGRVVWSKDQAVGLEFQGEIDLKDIQMPKGYSLN
ncbi:phospholipase effector Tle1 domain-containing protein [Sneathiella limimaris]|uniref:phospholipase effector Tle1 domain-containing protein n=1 Tax=Sneathiella limimaris TaxID=1964213 RepID=UPI00146F09A7|nr:DUF2235 domain-containing protein [Sneathiella limimaris]